MLTNSTPTKRKKSNAVLIRVPGRGVVGNVIGNEYRKRISDAGILRNPPAIANDIQALHDAERAGALYCVFTNTNTGIVYRASIAKIWDMGFSFNRGFGDQIGLALSLWTQTRGPDHSEPQAYSEPSGTDDVLPLRYVSRAPVGVKDERGGNAEDGGQMSLWGGDE